MPEFFLNSPWPAVMAWAVLYVSDFLMTLTCARLYHKRGSAKVAFEGSFELNPVFQRDIDSLRYFSPRFLGLLLLTSSLVALLWVLEASTMPEVYAFFIGAMISIELAIHVRHLTNLYLYGWIIGSDEVRGRLEYARPAILKISAVQILAFSVLFIVLFAFVASPFLAGGAASCALLSGKHWALARKATAAKNASHATNTAVDQSKLPA